MFTVVGIAYLLVVEAPIDCGATWGRLLAVVKPDGKRNDVEDAARKRGHFGIYAGWNEGRTFVACQN